jgi:MYXO-CTERM domain-containing protein
MTRAESTKVSASSCVRRTLRATRKWLTLPSVIALVALRPLPARAQVVEPNGVSVPVTVANGETTLQAYFDSQMEGIDALKEANAEPGVFAPQCDFTATLVLSQSGAQAGIAWYNKPQSPTDAPTDVYTIVPAGTPVGQVITSADILADPNYQKGLIGFVLMKNGARAYYSEYMRNVFCSGCTMPGYWKMALSYNSKKLPSTYYLAFEDWEGANATDWLQNDGDFNDKVFRISGVTCVGGGEACDTMKVGVCAAGLTECQPGGEIACHAQISPSAEKCDNLDNDCNGLIDDGDGLCDTGLVCDHGNCVPPCRGGEFACSAGLTCSDAGLCVDPACNGINCDAGQVCIGGTCTGGCEGVTCPLGQDCQLGRCVDLCAGVTCDTGKVCEKGICVADCQCRPCAAGSTCADSGHCVATGCDTVTCDAGQACVKGTCVDACQGAVCPGQAACASGVCAAPTPGVPAGTAGSSAGGTNGVAGGLNFDVGGSTPTTGGGASSSGGSNAATVGDGGRNGQTPPGCACRTAGAPGSSRSAALGALFAALLFTWRRRQRTDESRH